MFSIPKCCKYNVSVNNTTLYFIYNKNSILLGRHVSTFIRSSSDPLGKQIQQLSIFQCILGSQMYRNTSIDSSWICFPRGPEDELIKAETCRPDNILFLLYIYIYIITCYVIDWHVVFNPLNTELNPICQ
jgi:hypothetical protein